MCFIWAAGKGEEVVGNGDGGGGGGGGGIGGGGGGGSGGGGGVALQTSAVFVVAYGDVLARDAVAVDPTDVILDVADFTAVADDDGVVDGEDQGAEVAVGGCFPVFYDSCCGPLDFVLCGGGSLEELAVFAVLRGGGDEERGEGVAGVGAAKGPQW